MRWWLRVGAWCLGLCLLARLALRWVPLPPGAAERPSSLQVLDRKGHLLREVFGGAGSARPVELRAISPWLVQATLAAEDSRFYRHGGVDPQSSLGALWANLQAGRVVAGGSTLTQQLLQNLQPGRRGYRAKLQAALQALRLEGELSKDQILERYLNSAPYGQNTRGVESAARYYFGRPAAHLSLAQAAYLAGLPQGPELYQDQTLARRRQRWVLARMQALGMIDQAARERAEAEPVRAEPHPDEFAAPHFCDLVVEELPAGTRRVVSTLDGELQTRLQVLLRRQVDRLRARGANGAALVVLDNRSGEVRALVGSPDYFAVPAGQVNGAVALRQPGSTLKPFTYGLALEAGLTPASTVLDEPVCFHTAQGDFQPQNYDGRFHGSVRLRTALASSYNVPAVRLAHQVGAEHLLLRLRQAGLESLDKPAQHYGLALTLGAGEVNLLDLTNAYRSLARQGLYSPYKLWSEIQDAQGNTQRAELGTHEREVFSPRVAFWLTDILSDPGARAPGFGHQSVLALPWPCAVKTGTSRAYRDNWTVGYTTRYTVGVWVGNLAGQPLQGVSGVSGAAPLFREVMLALHEAAPPAPFSVPSGLRQGAVCVDSGMQATARCPGSLPEWFGSTLPDRCQAHQRVPDQHNELLTVEFPAEGDEFVLDPHLDRAYQTLLFRAQGPAPPRWTLNGKPVGEEWALRPGSYLLQARCGSQVSSVRFRVR